VPVETKVSAASVASTLTGLVVMLIGTLVFHGADVPALVVSIAGALVTGAVTFIAGWVARHTPRPPETTGTGNSAPLTTSPPTVAPASASSATPPADLPVTPPSVPPSTPPTSGSA
jgi:hypothetical protein